MKAGIDHVEKEGNLTQKNHDSLDYLPVHDHTDAHHKRGKPGPEVPFFQCIADTDCFIHK
jgi:hypothetical protein